MGADRGQTDAPDLRHFYQTSEGGDALIRLRDGIITRTEIKAEILRRVWWESAITSAQPALGRVVILG